MVLYQAGRAQITDKHSKPEWQKVEVGKVIYYLDNGTQLVVPTSKPLPPYGDDPRDQEWIKAGFQYYYKYFFDEKTTK